MINLTILQSGLVTLNADGYALITQPSTAADLAVEHLGSPSTDGWPPHDPAALAIEEGQAVAEIQIPGLASLRQILPNLPGAGTVGEQIAGRMGEHSSVIEVMR